MGNFNPVRLEWKCTSRVASFTTPHLSPLPRWGEEIIETCGGRDGNVPPTFRRARTDGWDSRPYLRRRRSNVLG